MKLSGMIENLNEIYRLYGDLECVYSVDEEGNAFHGVYFEPSVGIFSDGEFVADMEDPNSINAVCIN